MSNQGMTAEQRLMYWSQVVIEGEQSGLTVRAYCQIIGINVKKYYYWRMKMKKRNTLVLPEEITSRESTGEAATEEESETEQKVTNPQLTAITFTEIIAAPRQAGQTRVLPLANHGMVYIDLPRVTIRADPGYPTTMLSALAKELEPP